MGRTLVVSHSFVEQIPSALEDGVIYVSIEYGTVVHRCLCGCGEEVVTPLSPTDWRLVYDGECISLHPSVGNWAFKCQSHYWISKGRVRWARKWSQEEILAGRGLDRSRKAEFYDARVQQDAGDASADDIDGLDWSD